MPLVLPPELDPPTYRSLHADLQRFSDEELTRHYREFGMTEGRRANPIATREQFIRLIPTGNPVLEIGPFNKPLLTGAGVKYFDVLDRDGLTARAKSIGYDPANIPHIDFVSPTGDLSVIPEKFDYIASSHVIEHQPDLVNHLRQVADTLNPGGRYFLMAPDKRYCFDHFMSQSNLAHVIQASQEQRKVHTLAAVIEHLALATHNNCMRHWAGDHGEQISNLKHRVEAAVGHHQRSQGDYVDVHAWYFTPCSFRVIINALAELGMTSLTTERVYATTRGSLEFWAVLKRQ
jgi:SAM-dependent methyltransferase